MGDFFSQPVQGAAAGAKQVSASLDWIERLLSKPPFSRLTIAARITAIALTLAVPLNLVFITVIWRLSEVASETQRAGLLYTARSVAAAIDARLSEYMDFAQALSRSPALLEDDLDAFEAEARRAFASMSDPLVMVADLQGQQLINMASQPGQHLPVRNPAGLAAQDRAFKARSAVIADLRVGLVSHEWLILIEVPIFKNGQPFRALSVAVKSQSFFELLNAQQMPKNWLACIIDHEGHFIARVPSYEQTVGQLAPEGFRKVKDQDGIFEFLSVEGDAIVTANAHSTVSGWPIAIAIKRAEMQAAVWDAIRWAAALGGGFSLLSLLLAGSMARSITGPITELRQKAPALLAGPGASTPRGGPPEVRDLWRALIKSAQALKESEERFRGVFQHAVTGIVIRDMAERFLSCNPAYSKMLGYSEEELRALDFPVYVHPEDLDENITECKRLCAGEIPFFEIVNRYVCKEGKSIWVHKFVSLLRDPFGKPTNILVLVTDITERMRFEVALSASEERFRGIFEYAGTGIAMADMEGRLQSGNPAYCRMLGYTMEELRDLTVGDLMHPEDFEECMTKFRSLVAQEIPSFETVNRYLAKDGNPVWVHKHVSLLRDAKGSPVNALALVTNMTERKRQEDQIRLLMREVNHRSKNMLSLVLAVANQTLAANPQDFLQCFRKRIEALAANQDLLIKNAWKGVDLEELVRSQLAYFFDVMGTRIKLKGPTLFISASAAQVIGMAIHELATNAGKYGALSTGEGCVEIAWGLRQVDAGNESFIMTWRESCAHSITPPTRLGFGSSVISSMVEMGLGAKVELSFPATGLSWRLVCVAAEVLEGKIRSLSANGMKGLGSSGTVNGLRPRILVVEDEALIAIEIARELTEAGFEVVGPANSVRKAHELLKHRGCDAAVLDVNLGNETSEAIAVTLAASKTPFVTLTGYSGDESPSAFAGAATLAKPMRPHLLIAELSKCVERNGSPVILEEPTVRSGSVSSKLAGEG